MDEETEKRLAKLIMEEAAMLRRRADKEGVHVYLAKPTVRVRPNPQFLQATIRSVEQSNRIVEVNEMWRRRRAELNLDRRRRNDRDRDRDRDRNRDRDRSPRRSSSRSRNRDREDEEQEHRQEEHEDQAGCSTDLRDDELENFLNTRIKRGRGSVGPRMDDTGPYPAETTATTTNTSRTKEDWEDRLIGPRLPDKVADAWARAKSEADERDDGDDERDRKSRKDGKDKKRKKTKKSKDHKPKKRKRKSESD